MAHNSKGITDEQIIEALVNIENGSSLAKEAKKLGCCEKNIRKRRDRLIKRGLWKPQRDASRVVPDGYAIKRRSQMLYDNGEMKLEWLITEPDKERQAKLMMQLIENMTNEIPARPKIPKPEINSSQLANQFTMTDYHIGGYAWDKEGGANWSIKKAIEMGKAATLYMMQNAPKANTAIINQLGDWCHYDSLLNVTPTSGHIVASDGSPEQMIDASIELLDFMITEALRTHEQVKVIIAQGNHDLFSSVLLRRAFSYLYRDNRVEVIDNAVPFYAIKFGKNLLGYHHGHKVKFESLPELFANEFRHLYGETVRTLIHMGHYHHKHIKEFGKTVVEMHRTLSARDSHASYGGYHSERATDVITYHKEHGEVGRMTVTPEMLGVS